jgi:hypothetical protein
VAVSVAAAYVTSDGGSAVTSGNFDLVANDLYVLCVSADTANDTIDATYVITDNQTPDLTWTLILERDGSDGDGGGVVAYYLVPGSAVTGYNVTVTVGVQTDSPALKVLRIPAGEFDSADIVGAIAEGNLDADPKTTASITPETNGTGICVWVDWNQTGVPTSSDLTMTGFNTAGDISGGSGYKSLSTGVGATANINSGAAPSGNYIWFEIRGGAGGGGATQPPRSMHQYRMRRAA